MGKEKSQVLIYLISYILIFALECLLWYVELTLKIMIDLPTPSPKCCWDYRSTPAYSACGWLLLIAEWDFTIWIHFRVLSIHIPVNLQAAASFFSFFFFILDKAAGIHVGLGGQLQRPTVSEVTRGLCFSSALCFASSS